MQRFEYRDGETAMFWEIAKSKENDLAVRRGEIGSIGHIEKRHYETKSNRDNGYAMFLQKARMDYLPVFLTKALPQQQDLPRNSELEQMLFQEFDNADAWLVYGDWLQTQGDTRGELIVLNNLLTKTQDKTEKENIKQRLKELTGYKQRLAWAGEALGKILLYPGFEHANHHIGLKLNWQQGFIRSASLEVPSTTNNTKITKLSTEVINALFESPSALFLQKLDIHHHLMSQKTRETFDFESIITTLVNTKNTQSLQHLYIGNCNKQQASYYNKLGNIGPIIEHFPQLQTLKLCGEINLENKFENNTLKQIEIECNAENLEYLIQAKLPALQRLDLFFNRNQYFHHVMEEESIKKFFSQTHSIHYLKLKRFRLQELSLKFLFDSQLMANITSLDLSQAQVIAWNALAEHLKHNKQQLQELVLDKKTYIDTINLLRPWIKISKV